MTVTIFKDTVGALAAEGPANAWISQVAGEACRLVYMHEPTDARPASPRPAVATGVVNFADEYPVLLTSTASLQDFNSQAGLDTPMSRFRPNLVVDGAPAWAEDRWRRIAIGGAVFDIVQGCGRCIVTTIDQATGDRREDNEPLRSLGALRRDPTGKIPFGVHLTPVTCRRVAVGDEVSVLA